MVREGTATYQGSLIPKAADPAWELRVPDYGRRQRDMKQEISLNSPKVWPRMSFPLAWAKLTSASAFPKLKLFWEPG